MPDGSQMILLAILFPVVSALLLSFIPERSDHLRNPMAFFISLVTAVTVIFIFFAVNDGEFPALSVITIAPGLELAFKVDPLSALFGIIASVLWVFAVVYSTGYMAHEHKRRRYFVFYMLSLGITIGIAFSANLFTLYLFYEFLTICTYPLVIHEQNEEAQAAGVKYLVYSFGGAGIILIGMVMTYYNAGTLDFVQGGIVNLTAETTFMWQVVFFCFVIGFGVKAAIMPLHSWLPSAMAAPTPVSALLHAVAVVKSGVFCLLRVMYSVYGVETLQTLGVGVLLAVIVSITILVASMIAMRQDVLKKRLAYSTISQLGYITLGGALLTTMGLTGGLLHMVNHALLKITLFFCAGAIITVTGKKRISELKGLGKRMPLTMLAFTIGAVGMIGILPINGFISKWHLIMGAYQMEFYFVIAVLVGSAMLNAAYFCPIIIAAFFQKGDFEPVKGPEAHLAMLIPILVLAVVCIVFGFKLDIYLPVIENVVNYLM